MNIITKNTNIGDLKIQLISETDEKGKLWDTKVTVFNRDFNSICWISGEEIDNFLNEINEVISKYRI